MEERVKEDLLSASRGEEIFIPMIESLIPLVLGFYQLVEQKYRKKETRNKHTGNVYLFFCSLFKDLHLTEEYEEEGFDIIEHVKENWFTSAPYTAYLTEKEEDAYEYSCSLFRKYIEEQLGVKSNEK